MGAGITRRDRSGKVNNIELEEQIRQIVDPLSTAAHLEWEIDLATVSSVNVLPYRDDACDFMVIWSSQNIVISMSNRASWELTADSAGTTQLRRIVDAVAAGRVRKRGAPNSEVFALELREDDEVVEELVVNSGWKSWNRYTKTEVRCAPYGDIPS